MIPADCYWHEVCTGSTPIKNVLYPRGLVVCWMALATVEVSRERGARPLGAQHAYTRYDHTNFVVPNLAPKPFDAGSVAQRPSRQTWRDAPAPPPDPVLALIQSVVQRPAIALTLAYVLWLSYWSLYALRTWSDF